MTQGATDRLGRVVLAFAWFDLGLLVLLLPWSHLWEGNSLLTLYPGLMPILLSGYVRGIVSGIGVLDMVIAAEALVRRPAAVATRQ
jgi:hypothetical protein